MNATTDELLTKIRNENLNVYRASQQRLREDVGQESQIAQDYRGRLIYELLQNADDAMASGATATASIAFLLDDSALWVANSGRPLDEADVRGLCGISASSKTQTGKRRASIGHKGMGFKAVLEIADAPEVYSTEISFRFGPSEALRAVRELVDEGILPPVSRAPVTRFPWPVDEEPAAWRALRERGMQTAFRFPLHAKMTNQQRNGLAASLRSLPVTSLVFLKHLGCVEVSIHTAGMDHAFVWTVTRQRMTDAGVEDVQGFSDAGTYRVVLTPDQGEAQTFLLAYEPEIPIEDHRGGLDEVTWEGVTVTEVSIAARMRDGIPAALESSWRKLHVFLPTGEPCPYDLLVSGAFGSNLSRQELRVEPDAANYNRFLLGQVARVLRDTLLPRLMREGTSIVDVLRLLRRDVAVGAPCTTGAAQALYEAVRTTLGPLPILPTEVDGSIAIDAAAVPPLVGDTAVGRSFRAILAPHAAVKGRLLPVADLCGSDVACVLVDHGAHCLSPEEAAAALADADPARSKLDAEGKRWVDPVLGMLECLWLGLDGPDKDRLTHAVRRERLFPVGLADDDTARRIRTAGLTCFYPPRSLHGAVPLEGLAFLMQEICWGDLIPKERNQLLKQEMTTWQALFDLQEFKFPVVMRASVLPALDLDRDLEARREREALRTMERIAAICQLAGRMPDPGRPLPYERLGTNRALFNLSRLDVPCRGSNPGEIAWVPAYQAYFGQDWVGDNSVERVLQVAREIEGMSAIPFLADPAMFSDLLARYPSPAAGQSDEGEVGADEVSVDEDEDAALDADAKSRWLAFFQWLGVNQALRPVHFHDVEDRASGWLKTANLRRPDGWAFQKIPAASWDRYVFNVRRSIEEHATDGPVVPYFYQLHDLENLVVLLGAAERDSSAQVGKALYEHLARNWGTLERFSRATVALVSDGQVPSMRSKPPRAREEEEADGGPNFWMDRLQGAAFCPTGHGPRPARQVWLPTQEVERRFGRRGRTGGQHLVPTLAADPAVLKGKARAFAQALGMRDELTPANFSVEDARLVLERLRVLYADRFVAGVDLRQDLREVIRPAYRHLFELLGSRDRPGEGVDDESAAALTDAPLLGSDGASTFRFLTAEQLFYSDRRDTRDRVRTEEPIWTFVLEALPAAKTTLSQVFGVRVLEESLAWSPQPGDPALEADQLEVFRAELTRLAPYLLARIAVERSDERLARLDARRLRKVFQRIEPVTHLELGCTLDGRTLGVGRVARDAFVQFNGDELAHAFVVWGERAWPTDTPEAEALSNALCDAFGASYFEPFLALIQARKTDMWERLLRRAGAPLDIDERRVLFLGEDLGHLEELAPSEPEPEPKTLVLSTSTEQPAQLPSGGDQSSSDDTFRMTPLYSAGQLLVDGEAVFVLGDNAQPPPPGKNHGGGRSNSNGEGGTGGSGYGGRTDLSALDALGMWVTLSFERNRLRRSGLPNAAIFDPTKSEPQPDAVVFDVSSPVQIAGARAGSVLFDSMMARLHREFDIPLDWPGFDVLTIDPRAAVLPDRLIELKSSGIASRLQEMTWNEWKTATSSTLRTRFYLYLVGNLRSDLEGGVPYVRTIRNPFEQLVANVQVSSSTSRKVQLAVHLFKEAEYLELGTRRNVEVALAPADSGTAPVDPL